MKKRTKRVAVIGAGVSGLTVAAYLAGKGFAVDLYEKNSKPGGLVDTFSRGGYRFEATTHQVVGFHKKSYLAPVIKRSGLDHLQYVDTDTLFDVHYIKNGKIERTCSLPAGEKDLYKRVTGLFPDEKGEIRRFLKRMQKIAKEMYQLQRVIRFTNPLLYFADTLFAVMLMRAKKGSLFYRLGCIRYPQFARYSESSFYDLSRDLSPDLRSLLSQFWIYTGELPRNISGILYALIFYSFVNERPSMLLGGMSSLTQALVNNIEQHGGKIHLGCKVTSVAAQNGKVECIELADGEQIYADVFISTISTGSLFLNMFNQDAIPDDYFGMIQNLQLSPGCFQVYVGVPFLLDEYGLSGATHFYNYNTDIDYDRIPSATSPFILTNYTAFDSAYAPEGCSSFVLFEIDDHHCWLDLNKEEYRKLKSEREQLLLNKFEQATGIPVRARAEVIFSATSRTIKHYTGNRSGEAFGPASIVSQSMEKQTPYETPLSNLFLAGTYSYSSPGIGSSIDNGYVIAKQIFLKMKMMK